MKATFSQITFNIFLQLKKLERSSGNNIFRLTFRRILFFDSSPKAIGQGRRWTFVIACPTALHTLPLRSLLFNSTQLKRHPTQKDRLVTFLRRQFTVHNIFISTFDAFFVSNFFHSIPLVNNRMEHRRQRRKLRPQYQRARPPWTEVYLEEHKDCDTLKKTWSQTPHETLLFYFYPTPLSPDKSFFSASFAISICSNFSYQSLLLFFAPYITEEDLELDQQFHQSKSNDDDEIQFHISKRFCQRVFHYHFSLQQLYLF